jgi:hypothetical protein
MGQRENRQEKHGTFFPNKSRGKWNAREEVLKQKHYSKVLFPMSLLSLLPQPFAAKG